MVYLVNKLFCYNQGGLVMKCVLVSFFNSNNLGDILIGECLNDIVLKEFNEVKKVSYSGNLEVYNDGNIKEENNKNFKAIIVNLIKTIGLGSFLHFYYKNFKKINLEYFENQIINSDALIIGGGNMIFDIDKFSLSAKRFKTFVTIAKKYNKKVFAISLGIGPFQTIEQEKKAIEALELCDYITFRDNASYNIFKKYNKNHNNVYVSIDPVFLLPKKTKNVSHDKIIALNIINNKLMKESEKNYKNSINQYAKLADSLVKTLGKKVILFSTEIADYDAVYDVFKSVKNNNEIEILRITNTDELFDLYSNTLILIGTRMHAMIVAHSQQIPIIGLSWQQKVDEMFNIIESEEALFKYNEIDSSINRILKCAKFKIKNLEREKNKIKANLEKISKKIEINNDMLSRLTHELEDK
jgi:polysaccharide pyruvyl transferase WcaK-like protein